MGAIVLAFLGKNWGSLLIVAGIIAVVSAIYLKGRSDGAENATTNIERQNNDAASDADGDRARFDACPGGMWDFAARKCRGPAPRRGN
jgi:hypothetical protein